MSMIELFVSGGPWASALAVVWLGNELRWMGRTIRDHETRLRALEGAV